MLVPDTKTKYFAVVLLFIITGCKAIALLSVKSKEGHFGAEQSPANQYFWEQFHKGNYDSIPRMLEKLTAEYLQNPRDFNTTAHLGFTHMWALSERGRIKQLSPRITEHMILAKKYFEEARALKKDDARIHGFLAAAYLSEARVDSNNKKTVTGYFMMRDAIRQWPEFNYFTAGYVLIQLPADNKRFAEALEWQWKNLDVCACEKVDRQTADYMKYMPMETTTGKKRACWNNWIVAHNFEGFFLNMGDMLVKSGDWKTAVNVYNNAKLSSTYQQWPYKKVLEQRIVDAQRNTKLFNQPPSTDDATIMVNTTFSCMGCHQKS
jgi:hypothetical protein